MDKNSINIGPILSVRISCDKYSYKPFKISADNLSKNETSRNKLSAFSTAMQLKRSAEIIQKSQDDENTELESVTRELLSVMKSDENGKSVFLHLCGEWIFDLYLLKGKENQLLELCHEGLCNIPFASDFLVFDYIREFLCGKKDSSSEKLLSAVQRLSEYDFTKSQQYIKNSETYSKAVCEVIPKVLGTALLEKGKGLFVPEKKTIKRSSYRGLPCGEEYIKNMEIEYIPYSQNVELSSLITSALKYTENLIRQGMGVKSKLFGFTLSSEYRRLITDTIRSAVPGLLPAPLRVGRKPKIKIDGENKNKAVDEQVMIIEPVDLNVDFSKAKKLEAESWELAKLFGSDYGESEISFNVEDIYGDDKTPAVADIAEEIQSCMVNENIPEDWREFFLSLTEDEKKMLCCISAGVDTEAFARKRGGIPIGYAESINEKASDTYGDIVIDTSDVRIRFIEDYKEELSEIFIDMYKAEVL